jgi:hypothetical protein
VVLKSVFELRPPVDANGLAGDRADRLKKGHRRLSAFARVEGSTRDFNKATSLFIVTAITGRGPATVLLPVDTKHAKSSELFLP